MLTKTKSGALIAGAPDPTRIETMKIEILRSTVCGGRPVSKGDVVEASQQDANTLITMHKAQRYIEPTEPVAEPDNEADKGKKKKG